MLLNEIQDKVLIEIDLVILELIFISLRDHFNNWSSSLRSWIVFLASSDGAEYHITSDFWFTFSGLALRWKWNTEIDIELNKT